MKQKRKQPRIIALSKTVKLPGPLKQKGLAQLANIKTGRLINMSAKAAALLSNKYPREFKIL
ncbi:MAG: hypothetical protein H3C54_05115 [Taibaiella sp.]|nr:hypothetical protein [Taibaiella sp.]